MIPIRFLFQKKSPPGKLCPYIVNLDVMGPKKRLLNTMVAKKEKFLNLDPSQNRETGFFFSTALVMGKYVYNFRYMLLGKPQIFFVPLREVKAVLSRKK